MTPPLDRQKGVAVVPLFIEVDPNGLIQSTRVGPSERRSTLVRMSDTEVGLLQSLDDLEHESPEDRSRRRMQVIERMLATHRQILARRGGAPIPATLIDQFLDEVRGRADVNLD